MARTVSKLVRHVFSATVVLRLTRMRYQTEWVASEFACRGSPACFVAPLMVPFSVWPMRSDFARAKLSFFGAAIAAGADTARVASSVPRRTATAALRPRESAGRNIGASYG